MRIDEEWLRELVRRIMQELEEERQKETRVYMICTTEWEECFLAFLKYMETCSGIRIYPVVPESWKESGKTKLLQECSSCAGLLYRSDTKPEDLEQTVSIFPVISRDTAAKAALCIGDTYETSWMLSCIESGAQVILLRSGLPRFTGKEPKPYQEQILSYYRKLLEYGVRMEDEAGCGAFLREYHGKESHEQTVKQEKPIGQPGKTAQKSGVTERKPEGSMDHPEKSRKKRVITSSNVEEYASDGVLVLQKGDIVTDLARERAQFLNIVLKYKG